MIVFTTAAPSSASPTCAWLLFSPPIISVLLDIGPIHLLQPLIQDNTPPTLFPAYSCARCVSVETQVQYQTPLTPVRGV